VIKKILLLGHTGKMGVALTKVLSGDYEVVGKNSHDFDASQFDSVEKLIEELNPDIVINTVAFLGIDPCEQEPEKAFLLNTLYPKILAELSVKRNFLLVHFSTDAVFGNNEKGAFYTEEDSPCPLNLYGVTKYGGDCMVMAYAKRYYIFRLSVLFGEATKKNQFVEKMLQRIENGQKELFVADDVFLSPTYSVDIACKVKEILNEQNAFGLYHIANEGAVSLYEFMLEIGKCLNLQVPIRAGSFRDFPYIGQKNLNTPITSSKIKKLRSWQAAVQDYCNVLIKGE